MNEPSIIFEDRGFFVVNKPAGLLVHGTGVSKETTLTDWLLKKDPTIKNVGDEPTLRPGIVHRLDKYTSGIMVIARNQRYFEYLKALFQKHEIKKTYLALVAGRPGEETGTIDAPIGIRNGTTKRSTRSTKMAKSAITEYKVLKIFARDGADGKEAKFSLLEVSPKTGRTHQIRVHLSSIGHAIVGDPFYGPKKHPAWASRMMLHALSIEFATPDGKRMKFEAEPPPDFQSALA